MQYMSERGERSGPGATRNEARAKSAINNSRASGYVRAPEGVAQYISAEYLERSTRSTRRIPRVAEDPLFEVLGKVRVRRH